MAAIRPDGCSFVCQHLHVSETALVPWILEGMCGLSQAMARMAAVKAGTSETLHFDISKASRQIGAC